MPSSANTVIRKTGGVSQRITPVATVAYCQADSGMLEEATNLDSVSNPCAIVIVWRSNHIVTSTVFWAV